MSARWNSGLPANTPSDRLIVGSVVVGMARQQWVEIGITCREQCRPLPHEMAGVEHVLHFVAAGQLMVRIKRA